MRKEIQPLRLTIIGDFWDSLIYKGRLYLWDMDNSVRVYNWDSFIESLAINDLRLPFMCAFARGDLLYQPTDISSIVFDDSDIKEILLNKFSRVSQMQLVFTLNEMDKFLMSFQESPFRSLHDDSAIYRDSIYAITDTGLFVAGAHKARKNKFKVDRVSKKIWDGIGTSIQAGTVALAIAAADEGLFEYSLLDGGEPIPISERHTLFANWAFASIYGSSDISPGYLAAFRWNRDEPQNQETDMTFDTRYVREFSEIVNEDHIFGQGSHNGYQSLSWGTQEKFYRANLQGLDIVRFTQKNIGLEDEKHKPFNLIDSYSFDHSFMTNERVVSAGTSYFGVIIEYDSDLIVVESTGSTHRIAGPITRWRSFPRSVRYENHLHIVSEDRIDIFSFNNDYFVNQRRKSIGLEYRRDKIVSR